MDERFIIKPDGGKYDHRNDPDDVTGTMQADPELAKNMLRKGFVVLWAIDGRYRLTERGRKEMERRREEMRKERRQNSVRPFDNQELDKMAKREHENEQRRPN